MSFLRDERPVLITSARKSRNQEIADRERRYVLTMSVRVVALVLAVVAFHGVLRFVMVVVSLVLPWLAVVVANAAPAPSKESPKLYRPSRQAAIEAEPSRRPSAAGEVWDPDSDERDRRPA